MNDREIGLYVLLGVVIALGYVLVVGVIAYRWFGSIAESVL